jgi:hypothetical protein
MSANARLSYVGSSEEINKQLGPVQEVPVRSQLAELNEFALLTQEHPASPHEIPRATISLRGRV